MMFPTRTTILCLLLLPVLAPAQNPPASRSGDPPAPKPKPSSPPLPPLVLARPELHREDAIRLQIFLDQSHFGPGVIDGHIGRFTKLAIASWNEVLGHRPDDWQQVAEAARRAVPNPVATAVVPDFATDWVDPTLPLDRTLQATRKRMSYRRISEFMAERYHSDEDFLRELNGMERIANLKPRDTILVPNIEPFRIENLDGSRHAKHPQLSLRHVVVDTRIKQVRIFRPAAAALVVAPPGGGSPTAVVRSNRGLVASFPITPGEQKFIEAGVWELRNMVELPWWRFDQSLLDHGIRSPDEKALNIPPGPNSPVGIIWNGTSKPGVGLHGTSDPETIGRARSAGCIRLCNWDAIRLPQLIRPGASVEIR